MKLVEKEVRVYRIEGDQLLAIIEMLKEILNEVAAIYDSCHDLEIRDVLENDIDF
jgi:hypothetical protein